MNAPANIDPRRPFSVRSLAERWDCSEGAVRKLIDNGTLNHFRIGVLIRISAAQVEEYEACPPPSLSASNDSETGSPSPIETPTAFDDATGSRPRIARARRRRPGSGGMPATSSHGLSLVS